MAQLTKLTVSALHTLATRAVDDGRATTQEEVTGSKPFTNLEAELARYDASMKKQKTNLYTRRVVEADQSRDQALVGLRKQADALTYSPQAPIREAAIQVSSAISLRGGGIDDLPYIEESAMVNVLLADLDKSELQAPITTLALAPWIELLRSTQANFEAVYAERSHEKADESEVAAATTQRKSLHTALRVYLTYLEAMAAASTEAVWKTLYNQLRVRVAEAEASSRSVKETPEATTE